MSKFVVKYTREIICLCDFCDNKESILYEDYPDFRYAQQEIEDIGWFSKKVDGEWYDFCCNECWQEFRKEYKKNAPAS